MVAVGVSNELIAKHGGILQARCAILTAHPERGQPPEPFLMTLRDPKTGESFLVTTLRYQENKPVEVWVYASVAEFQERYERGVKARWGEPIPCG